MVGIFKRAIKPLLAGGIPDNHLLPIIPPKASLVFSSKIDETQIGKIPGRWLGSAWAGLTNKGTNRYLYGEFDPSEFDDFPTDSVGLVAAEWPAIDSDAENVAARVLVEGVVRKIFTTSRTACRLSRGERRLYAFQLMLEDGIRPIRPARYEYKLDGMTSAIDILGAGRQYLVAGRHPSGADYGWDPLWAPLDDELHQIVQADINGFVELFKKDLKAAGGEMTRETRAGEGTAGAATNLATMEPELSLKAVMAALGKFPNTVENVAGYDEYVALLGKIKAALGRLCLDPATKRRIRDWTLETVRCAPGWFDARWDSLAEVSSAPTAFDRFMRERGISAHHTEDFPEMTASNVIQLRKASNEDKNERRQSAVQEFIKDFYLIKHPGGLYQVVLRGDKKNFHAVGAWEWINGHHTKRRDISEKIYSAYRSGEKLTKTNFGQFLFDVENKDENVVNGFTSSSLHHYGEIITENDKNERTSLRLLNNGGFSKIVELAMSDDPLQGATIKQIMTLMETTMGVDADYELDTLAYMAQTGKRPGNALYFWGEKGNGKTVYAEYVSALFDTEKREIGGENLINPGAHRFLFSSLQMGSRVVIVTEMVKPTRRDIQALNAISSMFKKRIDAGAGGDWVPFEDKGKPIVSGRNLTRYIFLSNYPDCILIEQDDRRLFMVKNPLPFSPETTKWVGELQRGGLVDIRNMALFWRHLLSRNISSYDPFEAPPMTQAKQDAIFGNMHAHFRHVTGACRWLQASGRTVFQFEELMQLMEKCQEAERANGHINKDADPANYIGQSQAIKASVGGFMKGMIEHGKLHKVSRTVRLGDVVERITCYCFTRDMEQAIGEWPAGDLKNRIARDRVEHAIRPFPPDPRFQMEVEEFW